MCYFFEKCSTQTVSALWCHTTESGRKPLHNTTTVNILYLEPSLRIAYLQRGYTLPEKNAIMR